MVETGTGQCRITNDDKFIRTLVSPLAKEGSSWLGRVATTLVARSQLLSKLSIVLEMSLVDN